MTIHVGRRIVHTEIVAGSTFVQKRGIQIVENPAPFFIAFRIGGAASTQIAYIGVVGIDFGNFIVDIIFQMYVLCHVLIFLLILHIVRACIGFQHVICIILVVWVINRAYHLHRVFRTAQMACHKIVVDFLANEIQTEIFGIHIKRHRAIVLHQSRGIILRQEGSEKFVATHQIGSILPSGTKHKGLQFFRLSIAEIVIEQG